LALINSALTGGRSALFLTLLIYFVSNFSFPATVKAPLRVTILKFAVLGIVIAYYLYIFINRAQYGHEVARLYFLNETIDLGLTISPTFLRALPQNVWGDIGALLLVGCAYFTHSFSTMVQIVDADWSHANVVTVFQSPFIIAHKLIGTPLPN